MEIDRQRLIKLIEAFADTTHIFECELALYQVIVQTFCQQHHLDSQQRQELVDRARAKVGPEIKVKYRASHQDLLGKIPQIVDLLNSNQDEALAILKAWKPQGPVN